MGVVIGILVLLISIALVVLLALSEWYDFEPAAAAHQAAALVMPALAAEKARPTKKPSRRLAKAKPARRLAKRRA